MAEIVQALVNMGFPRKNSEQAVAETNCTDLQAAMDWLFSNQEMPSTSAEAVRNNPCQNKPFNNNHSASSVTYSTPAPSQPLLLVDEAWELIDPTPDIHALFISFSKQFFWDRLGAVEVKWSPRMTSCAGICSFHTRNRQCVISLSQPLLKLRPRKDLVETLLHEMIHAYLFLDSGTTDREGHGEQFHYHMYRINKSSGTKISVYHSFRDEVAHYKTHWWKCDGPCQHRSPFFGMVKRSMNRAPGPSDLWHEEHKRNCGGTFVKIREPPKDETKSAKGQGSKKNPQAKNGVSVLSPTSSNTNKKITDYFPGTPKGNNAESKKSGIVATVNDLPAKPSSLNTSSTAAVSSLFPGKGRKLNEGSSVPPSKSKPPFL